MKHLKENCTANNLILAGKCGLMCGNCLACKCGACQDLGLSLAQLESMETIRQGQTDDLKINRDSVRVWLSRLTIEDGMEYNNQVTIEVYENGKWFTLYQYEAK